MGAVEKGCVTRKGPGRDEAPQGLCACRVPGWLLTSIPLGVQGFAEGLAEWAALRLLAVLSLVQGLAGVAPQPFCVTRWAQAKRHSRRNPQLTRVSESGLFTAEASFHSLFPLLFSADPPKPALPEPPSTPPLACRATLAKAWGERAHGIWVEAGSMLGV